MKNFILPEQWYVLRTKETANVINEWSCSLQGAHHAYRDTECYFLNNADYQSISHRDSDKFIEGHTLITYQQFLEHVINQEPIVEDNTELNKILIKLLTE